MVERTDLLHQLRAVEAQLAAVAPGAHLKARLRARLRAEAHATPKVERGASRRRPRPLVFAFAVCAALIVLASRTEQPPAPEAVTPQPSEPLSVLPEKIRDDAGPVDPPSRESLPRHPRVIHAPALQDLPLQRFRETPAPELRSPMPLRAPSIAPSPREQILQEGSLVPWSPSDQRRKEGWKSSLLPGVNVLDSLPTSLRPAASSAPPLPNRPRVPSHDSSSPTPATPATPAEPSTEPANDPIADCRSADELKQEAILTCEQQGAYVLDLIYLDPCGDGRFRRVDLKCEVEDKPDLCSSGKLGDGVTCQDTGSLKWQAADACQQAGLTISDIKYFEDGCPAGLVSLVAYSCCPVSLPPPDPCSYGEIGDGSSCQNPTTLQQQAADACLQIGLTFSYMKSYQDCPGGASTKAFYACCPLAPSKP